MDGNIPTLAVMSPADSTARMGANQTINHPTMTITRRAITRLIKPPILEFMLTTDFTGTYDYERGEAWEKAQYFLEFIIPDSTPSEIAADVAKEAAHWAKCLDAAGFADFADEWNRLVPAYPMPVAQ